MIHTISMRKILIAAQCILSLLTAAALLFPFMQYTSNGTIYASPGWELLMGNNSLRAPLFVLLGIAVVACILNAVRLFNNKVSDNALVDYVIAGITAVLLVLGVYCFLICRGEVLIDSVGGGKSILDTDRAAGSYMSLVCSILCALTAIVELLPAFKFRFRDKLTAVL